MTRTTMKPRASLTVRIVLAVMAALLVMAALWAIVNLAAVNSYNQATQSLQENISTSRKTMPIGTSCTPGNSRRTPNSTRHQP